MPFDDSAELLANTDIVLSICPPHGAPKVTVAERTNAAGRAVAAWSRPGWRGSPHHLLHATEPARTRTEDTLLFLRLIPE
jgi:hypothetical protein